MINGCYLNENEIRDRLLSPLHVPGVEKHACYRRAAVLIPLICKDDTWQILFTRRSDTVHDHKGQVSFPGGAVDPKDLNPIEAALREANEEIGLMSDNVCVLGKMNDFPTISRYLVTPVVGRIQKPFEMRLSPGEVSRVFAIPIKWLVNRSNWEEKPYQTSSGEVHRVKFFKEYDGEILWGITAHLTVMFLKQIGFL